MPSLRGVGASPLPDLSLPRTCQMGRGAFLTTGPKALILLWTRPPHSGSTTKGREANSYLRKGSVSRIQEFFLFDLPGAEGEVHTGSCCLLSPSGWAGVESWSKGLSVKLGVGWEEAGKCIEKNQWRSWFQVGPLIMVGQGSHVDS